MNSSIASGRWQQLKGALAVQWGALTGDRLRVINGRHQQLTGGLHVAYGIAKDQLARQINGIERRSVHPRSHVGGD
ncbi:MAG: hypothetical protein ABI831_18510 [Betaproteobacteria bacterium]